MHVQALFRVLNVVHDHSGVSTVSMAPTYSTRDGMQCAINKAFWEATPSGSAEIRLAAAADAAARELFAPGAYVQIDMFDDESEVIGHGAIRTDWQLVEVALRPTSFRVDLSPVHGPYERDHHDNGRNAALWARSHASGFLRMEINNLSALPFFAFEPRRDGAARRIVVDFTPG